MTFVESLGHISSLVPSRGIAAILLLSIAAKTAMTMIKGGEELRLRYWPGVSAVSVAMVWVLASPLVPETAEAWVSVAIIAAGLAATTCRPQDPGSSEESIEFLELLRGLKKRDGFQVFAWSLLSNHFHLALRTSAVPLSRTMRTLQGGYSKAFNRRWRRTGPLWPPKTDQRSRSGCLGGRPRGS